MQHSFFLFRPRQVWNLHPAPSLTALHPLPPGAGSTPGYSLPQNRSEPAVLTSGLPARARCKEAEQQSKQACSTQDGKWPPPWSQVCAGASQKTHHKKRITKPAHARAARPAARPPPREARPGKAQAAGAPPATPPPPPRPTRSRLRGHEAPRHIAPTTQAAVTPAPACCFGVAITSGKCRRPRSAQEQGSSTDASMPVV